MARKGKKIEYIKRDTVDDAILAATDRMAFTQDELIDLLDKGITEVYFLCVQFVVPEGVERISYRSVNHPIVKFNIIESIEKAAEQGDIKAQIELDRFRAVKLNDPEAQARLGDRYYKGEDVEKDYKEAVKWYRMAAEQGNATAQYGLGVCYGCGEGIEQNYEEGAKWYRKAAEQGYAPAQNNLGVRYHFGHGVALDYEAAVKWFKMAAKQGDADAQFNLGEYYRYGYGVKRSRKKTIKWYRKAAKQRHTAAQYELYDLIDED